jgi:hypothetical protein
VADPGAVGQRWRQVLADVGYLRRELKRLGPRDVYVRRAQTFDEASVRDVAAFERVYERLANELDHLVRDYLMRRTANSKAQAEVENASAASVFDAFARAQRLPIASRSSLRRAAMARNALQHDYLNVRAADVFDGTTELLAGVDAILAAVRLSWNELGVDLPAPPSAGHPSAK